MHPPLLSIKHFSNVFQISPFSDQIISLLPPLWESSGEEHLMKQAILTLLSSLIRAMKQESVRYHSLIIPLIQSSVEPGSVRYYPYSSTVYLHCNLCFRRLSYTSWMRHWTFGPPLSRRPQHRPLQRSSLSSQLSSRSSNMQPTVPLKRCRSLNLTSSWHPKKCSVTAPDSTS